MNLRSKENLLSQKHICIRCMKYYTDKDQGKLECKMHTHSQKEKEMGTFYHKCCNSPKYSKGCHLADHVYSFNESEKMLQTPFVCLFEKDIDVEYFENRIYTDQDQRFFKIYSKKDLDKTIIFATHNSENKYISIDLNLEYKTLLNTLPKQKPIPNINESQIYSLYYLYENESELDQQKIDHTFKPFYVLRTVSHKKIED